MPRSAALRLLPLALVASLQLRAPAASAAPPPPHEVSAAPAPSTWTRRLGAAVKAELQHGSGETQIPTWSGSVTQHALGLGQVAASVTLATALHLDRGWQVAAAAGLAYAGYQVADLAAGTIHCLLDGYGSKTTPLLGAYLETFKTHHHDVRAQTRASIPYLVAPFTLLTMPLLVGASHLPAEAWALQAGLLGLGIGLPLAGVSHKYSHLRDKVGSVVRGMRGLGLMLKPAEHDRHHRYPNNIAFGQLTGRTNALAERVGYYTRLQALIYRTTGAVHDSWRSPRGGHEAMVAALGPDASRHPKLPSSGR